MKEWYTIAELSLSLLKSKRAILKKATNENWPFRKRDAQGGGREYHIDSLPIAIKKELLREFNDCKQDVIENSLSTLTKLTADELQKVEIRESILKAFQAFKDDTGLSKSKAVEKFCESFNNKDVLNEPLIRNNFISISSRTIQNWSKNYQTAGASGLADNYGNRKGQTKIDANIDIKNYIIGLIYEKPHVECKMIIKGLRVRFDSKILPSYRTVRNWVSKWKEENQSLFLAIKNPDAWKSKFQAAAGSQSENITRLNQRWEFDSTPTDIMLNDGSRHNIVGVIDVYSRRLKLLVSNTSNSKSVAAITRACLLEWGVPEEVKTDNGADYKSKHMVRIFETLEIAQHFCKPFTPEGKPHIERVFKTFSHDLMEMLPGYIGHNVMERKDIEARKSFGDHIMGKAKQPYATFLSIEDLQTFCDDWIKNYYMQEPHGGLQGKTPQSMIANYTGNVRTIKNERALDILLSETSGDGLRTVTKKGIAIENAHYDSNFLAGYEGKQVKVLYDECSFGEIYVFDLEMNFICKAICPERKGISRQEVAVARKAKQKRLISEGKAALKKLSKEYHTKDIVNEILNQKAVENNIVCFPNTEVPYFSKSLIEAENILKSKDKPISRELTNEESQFLNNIQSANSNKIVEIPSTLMAKQKYEHWLELDSNIANGERLNADDLRFYRNYQQSSEFSTQQILRELDAAVM